MVEDRTLCAYCVQRIATRVRGIASTRMRLSRKARRGKLSIPVARNPKVSPRSRRERQRRCKPVSSPSRRAASCSAVPRLIDDGSPASARSSRVPRDRSVQFSTWLFERFQRSEKGLVSALVEMYVQGVSTRKVKAIAEELCGHSFATAPNSAINKGLDEGLTKFANRQLTEGYLRDARRKLEGPRGRDHSESRRAARHRHQLGGTTPGARCRTRHSTCAERA